jgi:hypothetical protein
MNYVDVTGFGWSQLCLFMLFFPARSWRNRDRRNLGQLQSHIEMNISEQ